MQAHLQVWVSEHRLHLPHQRRVGRAPELHQARQRRLAHRSGWVGQQIAVELAHWLPAQISRQNHIQNGGPGAGISGRARHRSQERQGFGPGRFADELGHENRELMVVAAVGEFLAQLAQRSRVSHLKCAHAVSGALRHQKRKVFLLQHLDERAAVLPSDKQRHDRQPQRQRHDNDR